MEATLGGSGGVQPDPSPEAGWSREKKLKYRRNRERIIRIKETGTRLEQEQEEKKIIRRFLQKIRKRKR